MQYIQYNGSVEMSIYRERQIRVAKGLQLQTEQSWYKVFISWPTYVKRWSLSGHEEVWTMKLRFERSSWWWEKYLSKCSLIEHTCSWRINLLYYEYWIDKRKYFYVWNVKCLWIYSIRILIYRSYLSYCGPSNLSKPAKDVRILVQVGGWWERKNVCTNPGGWESRENEPK